MRLPNCANCASRALSLDATSELPDEGLSVSLPAELTGKCSAFEDAAMTQIIPLLRLSPDFCGGQKVKALARRFRGEKKGRAKSDEQAANGPS